MTNRRELFFIPVAEYNSVAHQARTLKTNLLGLISTFSKYYFKTGLICLLFLSSRVFTALEFDSNHFGILLWQIIKPRDHNKIKPPTGKIFRKYKQSEIILWCSKNNCLAHLWAKFTTTMTRYPTSKGICYNLKTIFHKKINFSQ